MVASLPWIKIKVASVLWSCAGFQPGIPGAESLPLQCVRQPGAQPLQLGHLHRGHVLSHHRQPGCAPVWTQGERPAGSDTSAT